MRVLLLGGGGREHTIGWKLAQSSDLDLLISAPGNPGLADFGPVVSGFDINDPDAVTSLAISNRVDLVVVGPEAPLAAGVVDSLIAARIRTCGPGREGAQLESSKAYAKQVMARAGIPTAPAHTFTDVTAAIDHLTSAPGPYVVKADGLAAGKGVLVTQDLIAAQSWARLCLEGHFGDAGSTVVVEDYLHGPEVSIFVLTDGVTALPLAPARDYKRLLENDEGPNTGGMGSYSPVDDLPADLVARTMADVIRPTLAQMAEDGNAFTGFLYAGLVLTEGGPKVLEFNVRLGDPETQAVLPRMESDFVDVLEGATPTWSNAATVNVVLAAQGYPTAPDTGDEIRGLSEVPGDVMVLHAGTRTDGKRILVNGGRVLSVVGKGSSIALARERAYEGAAAISWPGLEMRTDIGD